MSQPSLQIQEKLLVALRTVQNSPDLTPDEAEWLHRYAMRLIAEFGVIKSEAEVPTSPEPIPWIIARCKKTPGALPPSSGTGD